MLNLEAIRPSYMEVDIDKILYNMKLLKERLGKETKLMAIVKGDFYGLGIKGTLKYLEEGADSYGVAMLSEAIELRRLGTNKDILILGYTPPYQYKYLLEYEIIPTMYDLNEAKELSELALKEGKKAKIHIKVDTGMTRLGFDTSDESVDIVEEISKLEGIEIDGIFSHFTSSEEIDKEKTHIQGKMFFDFCDKLESRGVKLGDKHISNSGAVIDLPEYKSDLVRNGYNLTGLYDPTIHYENLPIKLTCRLRSIIARVRTVPKGTGVGYNTTFVTEKEETKIATIPLGYTDGYKKLLSNKGEVLINGKRAPIRGSICMDQFMVEVTDIDCKVGDEVVLFGYKEENGPTILEISELLNTGNIDIISTISRRIPRVYKKDGEIVDIVDYILD